jgi:hypothetical protein
MLHKRVKNVSGAALIANGQALENNEEYTITEVEEYLWRSNSEVISQVTAGNLDVGDETHWYSGSDGVQYLCSLLSPGNGIVIQTSKTPASASDTGQKGMICWDSSYLYICVATDTWKRINLSTW